MISDLTPSGYRPKYCADDMKGHGGNHSHWLIISDSRIRLNMLTSF